MTATISARNVRLGFPALGGLSGIVAEELANSAGLLSSATVDAWIAGLGVAGVTVWAFCRGRARG